MKPLQWQNYKLQELLPESLPYPTSAKVNFNLGAPLLWRGLVNALSNELIYEQRIEHLDRCWQLELSKTESFKGFWFLLS